jgi:hypothetical protein
MSSTVKLVLVGVLGVAVGYATCYFVAKNHHGSADQKQEIDPATGKPKGK